MDWIQTLTILGSIGGLFIYLMNRIDKIDSKFEGKIDQIRNEMNQLRQEMHQGFSNLQNYILLAKIDKKLNKDSEKKD